MDTTKSDEIISLMGTRLGQVQWNATDPCLFTFTPDKKWQSEPKQEAAVIKPEALKFDYGKPRYSLIPHEALDGLARLFTRGGRKYGDRNWELGMDWSRVYDAMHRHAGKWFAGETYDQKDHQHHLLSVMWCAMVLYAYEARKVGNDDRPTETVIPGETFWTRPVPDPMP